MCLRLDQSVQEPPALSKIEKSVKEKHQNCRCQGPRTPFSSTLISLVIAQRWFPKPLIMFLQRTSMLNIIPEIYFYSFKILVARAARLHFQHHHEPEAGSVGGFKKHQYFFFIRPVCWTKYPKFMLTASKLWMPGPQDSTLWLLIKPEAGHEGGIRNYW